MQVVSIQVTKLKMVERQKEKYGWEFLFIGANIDSAKTAKDFGIAADRAVNYHADHQGTGVVFDTVSKTACLMRASMPIDNRSDKINKDYSKRKKNNK